MGLCTLYPRHPTHTKQAFPAVGTPTPNPRCGPAGQFLFSVEPDWVRFFVHITDPRSGQLITPDKAQAVQVRGS